MQKYKSQIRSALKDIIKNSIITIEKITADLIEHCQQQLLQEKKSIIERLNSAEQLLLDNISQNPKFWNSECLQIDFQKKIPVRNQLGVFAVIDVQQSRKIRSIDRTEKIKLTKSSLSNGSEVQIFAPAIRDLDFILTKKWLKVEFCSDDKNFNSTFATTPNQMYHVFISETTETVDPETLVLKCTSKKSFQIQFSFKRAY